MLALRPLLHPILLTSPILALGGCGAATVDTAALRTQLSGVADALDRCVAKTNDARRCTTDDALGSLPGRTELGAGPGQIQIQGVRALRYELVSNAGDDAEFSVIAAPVGARKRVCRPAGAGDCPSSGAW